MSTENSPASVETIAPPPADNPNPEIAIEAPAPVPIEREAAEPAPKPKTAVELRTERLNAKAKRLQEARAADKPPEFSGDFSEPGQTTGNIGKSEFDLKPEFVKDGDTPTDPSQQAKAPETGETKRKFKLKVRHQDMEMDEDQVLALAQKAAAADSYFEDGRRFYEEARRQADSRRAAGAPQQGQPRAQDEQPHDPSQGDPHQDPLAAVLEKVQFGADPKEAARELRTVVNQTVLNTSQRALVQQKMAEDVTETLTEFQRIKSENPTLFADEFAEPIMQKLLLDGYKEDLRKIGVPENRIPVNPNDLADWHRFYRIKGQPVRKAGTLLNDVKQRYSDWRSGTKTPNKPVDSTSRVAVNRDDRRASIPSQPTRSAAPQQVPQAAPQRKTREQVMADMRAARRGRSAA